MRFQKRVKMGSGTYMNLSRSGVGMSVGGPGLSISYGKKGMYVNTGIPGSGLSSRHKIGGGRVSQTRNGQIKVETEISVEAKIDDNKNTLFYWGMDRKLPNGVIARKGDLITDTEVLTEIKKSDGYRELIKEAIENKVKEVNAKTQNLTDIFKESPKIVTQKELEEQLKKIKSPNYFEKVEGFEKPSLEESLLELEAEAKKKIRSILFWNNRKKREDFIASKIDAYHKNKLQKWEERIKKLESSKKELIDELVQSLIGDSNYINDTFTKFVESLGLPIDFFVDFQYDSPNKEIKIDLDLPEIEDLPNQFAEVTQSGRLSIKNKSQKQLKEEYVKCSLGLGIFLACNVFNTSPVIQKVQVSGYTQRLSKKTGHITDEYETVH